MSNFKFITFCFIISLCSCNDDSRKQVETTESVIASFSDQYSVIENGVISIPIDKETANWSSKIDIYSNNNKEYLVYQNDFNEHLQFYDIETGEKTYSLKLSTTGPNSVKCLSGFLCKIT
ncbi:MAG: DUF4221 family protein [Saprospiraceae bacterium]|nr:DUF4221 family protein [Saprospiraceae bacterium]